jgi:methionyl-tRNA formyltransferase
MRILFMGTPDFAAVSLNALLKDGKHEICGVVTQPDKPRGRKYELQMPPVKRLALENSIDVYQPETLKDGAFEGPLNALQPDLIAVVAYGKILPKYLLDFPKYGCINVHGSLLPKYRGAAPMQRAIMEGEQVTGITTMYMAQGLDTGDMLLKEEYQIKENDNFENVHDALAQIGGRLLIETIEKLESNCIVPEKQDDSLSTYAAKIEKADCALDFTESAEKLHNIIRGLSPIPLAYTNLPNGKLLKIISAEICKSACSGEPGTVIELCDRGQGYIRVACKNGALDLKRVKAEGKSEMNAADFIRGRGILQGDKLESKL